MSTAHICRGTGTRFVALVRSPRARRWERVSGRMKSIDSAIAALTRAIGHRGKTIGEVIMTADYYDAVTVFEARIR